MKQSQEKPWLVSDGYTKTRIDLNEVEYVEAERMYCTLHMADGVKRYTLSRPLCQLEMPEEMFVRVSRSHVIHIWHVRQWAGRSLTMDSGTVIRIGEQYLKGLEERFCIVPIRKTAEGCSEESSDGSEKKAEKRKKSRQLSR